MMSDTEIWLAGKGPSLDTFDWSKAGKYRVGINEAAFVIPDCYGAIAIDYYVLDKYLTFDKIKDGSIKVFRKQAHVSYDFPNQHLWTCTAFKGYSTASVALDVFSSLGFNIFHLVGFDSISNPSSYQYADNVKVFGEDKDRPKNYDRINAKILEVITEKGIEVIWEHLIQL